jgi:hypothetical protein
MLNRVAVTVALAVVCSLASAQAPATRMYPGTDFPGNDLVNMPAASPEECAARCAADGRCTAFTFAIPSRQCYLKWAPSRFDGSLTAVSGVIEGRPISPPGGGAPPGYYPPAPVVVPIGPPSACSARGNDVCSGCSVSCPSGQQASCREGEVHGSTCWTKSTCQCVGPSPAPPSVYTPGEGGGPNTNSCSTPDRFGCKGCFGACAANESPICTPSIPGEGNSCHSQAFCRCQPK